jgi:hypothetical protein
VSHPSGYLNAICLDLHASAAPIPKLAAVELEIDRSDVHGNPGRQAFKYACQALSMRLPTGDESEHSFPPGCRPGTKT